MNNSCAAQKGALSCRRRRQNDFAIDALLDWNQMPTTKVAARALILWRVSAGRITIPLEGAERGET